MKSETETYSLPYVKVIGSASLMHKAGHPKLVLRDNLERQAGEGGGRGVQDGGDTWIPMADSY